MLNSIEKKSSVYLPAVTLILSIILHLVLIIIAMLVYHLNQVQVYSGGAVEIGTVKGSGTAGRETQQQQSVSSEEKEQQGEPVKENTGKENAAVLSNTGSGAYAGFESAGSDSGSLTQIYQEPTLNVRMKYPPGWVFIDQQRKNKLDGITFWLSGTAYNPPPYIHVEVVEKYMFNPLRYKYSFSADNFTGYYNDPEEIENQVTQIIYLKTEDDEDFTIKLIMNNPEEFKSFQPTFYAIIKSFRFGSSLF